MLQCTIIEIVSAEPINLVFLGIGNLTYSFHLPFQGFGIKAKKHIQACEVCGKLLMLIKEWQENAAKSLIHMIRGMVFDGDYLMKMRKNWELQAKGSHPREQ